MERNYRIAIIGSGPSGFFSAEHLLRLNPNCEVDMYERYPDPFGLVRRGVAPDSQNIRNVSKAFDEIAKNPRFIYFGNVDVGIDVSLNELRPFYDAIILACGMETSQRLGIPGEDLYGSYTASSIVGWYNCHPVYQSLDIKLDRERVFIIGMGNVAIDVARILTRPIEELKGTDISDNALETLKTSKIKEIYIVGRRGPAQVKFKENELLTLEEIGETDILINPEELILNEASDEEVKASPSLQRIMDILKRFSETKPTRKRRIYFLFLRTPIRIEGQGRVERVLFEKNVLEGMPNKQKATGSGEIEVHECDYIISSIGYRGNKFPGVPYDEMKGIIPNIAGRVVKEGTVIHGLYVTGWIKRGPVGLIGNNKPDSLETVKNLLADLPTLPLCEYPQRNNLIQYLKDKDIKFITYEEWKKLDQYELEQGEKEGKVRKRLCDVEEMLKLLNKVR